MNDLRIDFSELQRLEAQLLQAPEAVRDELSRAVTEADVMLANAAAELTPRASGLLQKSLYHVEKVNGLAVEGFIGSALNYVAPVELGTKPHFPPLEPLIDWVKTRLQVAESEARGVAFLVARKIARKGTEGARMFEQTLDSHRGQVDEIFRRAQERILARLGGAA